jgi:acyl carrier protein
MGDLEKFLEIVSTVFSIAPESIKDELTPDEIDKWDSVTHMELLSNFEKVFGVTFDMEEISEMQSIGVVKKLLAKKGLKL